LGAVAGARRILGGAACAFHSRQPRIAVRIAGRAACIRASCPKRVRE
jgi:hypothetical protein